MNTTQTTRTWHKATDADDTRCTCGKSFKTNRGLKSHATKANFVVGSSTEKVADLIAQAG